MEFIVMEKEANASASSGPAFQACGLIFDDE